MLSPHIGALAAALSSRGFKVIYVANHGLFKERSQQGWETPNLGKAKLILASNKADFIRLASKVPSNSVHITQGLRGNGLIKIAQNILREKNIKHLISMETVDDTRWHGVFKRILYRFLFLHWRNSIAGVLAIGKNTPSWVIKRGMEPSRVYSFAYFLKDYRINHSSKKFKKKEILYLDLFMSEI